MDMAAREHTTRPARHTEPAAHRLFAGPGEMRSLCRSFDWSKTSLGALSGWPQSLRTVVDVCLGSAFPSFVWWGPELVQLYNDAALAIVRGKHPASLGMPARQAWAEVWDTIGSLLERAAAGEAVRGDDVPMVPDRGGPRETAWFTFSCSPVRDEAGAFAGVFCSALETTDRVRAETALRERETWAGAALDDGTIVEYCIDVSDRHLAEATLRQSESRYRLIVEGARDYAIITTDPDGRITSWSPGAEATFGWAAAEVVGRSFALLFVSEDRAAGEPERELAGAAEHGVASDVRWHEGKDGIRVFMDGTTRALRDERGLLSGFLKVGQDVTRRRAQDEALQASEARYRTLVENVCDYAIFLLDARGVVTEWTPGAERVKGYSSEEVLGRHFAMFFNAEDVAAGEPARELAEAAETGRAEREGWRVRKGGERFWVNEIATAVRDRGGRLAGFTNISRDLTERRQAEEAAELVRAAAERDALRRRLVRAEEDERRRLSRELHDEAGQHLTALALGLQGLSDVAPADSEVDRRAAALRTLASTLARELHAVAVRLRPRALDDFGLEAALSVYAEDWSRQSGIAAEVHTHVATERLPDFVESALYRIVQEALTNVARHSGARRASILVERRDGHVVAVVEDDGCGFEPDRVGVRDGGTGLGLLGMRERCTLLGGSLEVESTPGGGGTTLFVRIPIVPPGGGDWNADDGRSGDG